MQSFPCFSSLRLLRCLGGGCARLLQKQQAHTNTDGYRNTSQTFTFFLNRRVQSTRGLLYLLVQQLPAPCWLLHPKHFLVGSLLLRASTPAAAQLPLIPAFWGPSPATPVPAFSWDGDRDGVKPTAGLLHRGGAGSRHVLAGDSPMGHPTADPSCICPGSAAISLVSQPASGVQREPNSLFPCFGGKHLE